MVSFALRSALLRASPRAATGALLRASPNVAAASARPPLLQRRLMSSSHFSRMDTPINIGLVVVPQQMAFVVERFGQFDKVLEPGLRLLVPVMHRIRYVFSLKEEALTVPSQAAVTRDNVQISIDGVYVAARARARARVRRAARPSTARACAQPPTLTRATARGARRAPVSRAGSLSR